MYGKLFASLFDGSLMDQPLHVRYVFMALIALADGGGFVDKTARAIANQIGLSEEETRDAIARLSEPDPNSRSEEEEGRRLIPMRATFGWKLTNFEKYREMSREAERREKNNAYMREYMRQRRAKERPVSDQLKAVKSRKRKLGKSTASAFASDGFDAVAAFEVAWTAYPKKRGSDKKAALAEFKKTVTTEEDHRLFLAAQKNYTDELTRNEWRSPRAAERFFRDWRNENWFEDEDRRPAVAATVGQPRYQRGASDETRALFGSKQ